MNRRHVAAAARGGGIVFGGQLFAWGARFVLAVVLARLLGASNYGLYTVTLAVAAVVSALAVFGLDAAMIRYVSIYMARNDAARLRGTLQLGFTVPLALGSLVGIGLVLLSDVIAGDLIGDARLAPLLRIAGLLVPAMVLNSILSAMLQGLRRFGSSVLAEQFLQPTSRMVLLIGFALVGMSPTFAMVAMLVSTVVVSIVMLYALRAHMQLGPSVVRPTGEILRFTLPVYFSNIVQTFSGNLQTLLLGALTTVAKAGVFAIANQIQLVGSLFHSAIVRSSMPLFAELHDTGDRARLEHLYQTTSKWTFSLNMPFFLVSIAFPEALMSLFGSDFTDGAAALVILAWGAIVKAGTGTSGAMLDMTGHTAVKLLNSSVSVALAIALSLLLIPRFGVEGAAIAAVASVAAVNVLRVVEVARLEKVGPYNASYRKPLIAGVAAYAAAMLVAHGLAGGLAMVISAPLGIGALLAVYVGMLYVLGVDDDDRFVLGRAANRFRRRRGEPGTRAQHDPGRP
ncbi:MAG: flippase [Candidatus Limnocylindria bacterium]